MWTDANKIHSVPLKHLEISFNFSFTLYYKKITKRKYNIIQMIDIPMSLK